MRRRRSSLPNGGGAAPKIPASVLRTTHGGAGTPHACSAARGRHHHRVRRRRVVTTRPGATCQLTYILNRGRCGASGRRPHRCRARQPLDTGGQYRSVQPVPQSGKGAAPPARRPGTSGHFGDWRHSSPGPARPPLPLESRGGSGGAADAVAGVPQGGQLPRLAAEGDRRHIAAPRADLWLRSAVIWMTRPLRASAIPEARRATRRPVRSGGPHPAPPLSGGRASRQRRHSGTSTVARYSCMAVSAPPGLTTKVARPYSGTSEARLLVRRLRPAFPAT